MTTKAATNASATNARVRAPKVDEIAREREGHSVSTDGDLCRSVVVEASGVIEATVVARW